MLSGIATLLTLFLSYNGWRNLRARRVLNKIFTEVDTTQTSFTRQSNLTLAIPARNEESNLKILLEQLVCQSLRPTQILILNDSSTDSTEAVIKSFTQTLPELSIVQGASLPEGWRGKVWALKQLLGKTETPSILFLDADVRLPHRDALSSLWNEWGLLKQSGFLSVFPRATCDEGAGFLVHQIQTHLLYLLPSWEIKQFADRAVAGCGQVMLAETEALRNLGAFDRLFYSTHDGLMLARLFKHNLFNVRHVDGGDFFTSDYYPDFGSAFLGFSRNDFEATETWGVVIGLCLVFALVFIYPFLNFWSVLFHPLWTLAFASMLVLQYQIAVAYRFPLTHVILTPVKASASIGVHLWSFARRLLQLKTIWKDRAV